MRGKISDQDLTNYALNDGLDARERLYVESMLAVSEECRQDIYRGIELAQMLEAGFERQQAGEIPMLTAEQRSALLRPQPARFGMSIIHRTAATLAMAACTAFVLANPNLWQMERQHRSLAAVTTQMTDFMEDMTTDADAGFETYVSMPTDGDEGASLIKTSSDSAAQPSAMCTPPTLDTDDFAELK